MRLINRRRWRRVLRTLRRLIYLPAALASLLCACAAEGDYVRRQAFDAVRGPAQATGAVIWSHGMNAPGSLEASGGRVPPFVQAYDLAGWDVMRLDRPRMSEEPRTAARALARYADELHLQGYKRIVLVGHSAGAWISVMAAGRSDNVDVVVAMVPAYYGPNNAGPLNPSFVLNESALLGHLEDVRRAAVLLAFFDGDPYDAPTRSLRVAKVLEQRGLQHVIIDHPAGFTGHLADYTPQFTRLYGPCILRFATGTAAAC